jgi:hypothetical protein
MLVHHLNHAQEKGTGKIINYNLCEEDFVTRLNKKFKKTSTIQLRAKQVKSRL